MAEKLHLEIITPDSVLLTEDVETFEAPGVDGEFQILPGHTPYLTSLRIGQVNYSIEGNKKYISISGGFCEVQADRTVILAHTAEYANTIDITRANDAKSRAEKRIESNDPAIDDERAQSALLRAINRINVASIK